MQDEIAALQSLLSLSPDRTGQDVRVNDIDALTAAVQLLSIPGLRGGVVAGAAGLAVDEDLGVDRPLAGAGGDYGDGGDGGYGGYGDGDDGVGAGAGAGVADSVLDGPFVPDFHMPAPDGAATGATLTTVASGTSRAAPFATARVLVVQCPVMELKEAPAYLRGVLAKCGAEPPQVVVLPCDIWGRRTCTSLRKSR